MTKSQLSNFIGLYSGILEDIRVYHPTLHVDLGRDLLRLKTLSSNMGEKVFTLLLPAIGKKLDAAFESGVLDFGGLPLTRSYSRKSRIPRLFRGIWLTIFDDYGCLKSNIDPTDVFFLRTLLLGMKRYQSECASSATFEAVKEYYDVDESLPSPSFLWDDDGSSSYRARDSHFEDFVPDSAGLFGCDASSGDRQLLQLAQQCADRVAGVLGEYIPGISRFRHGPGAVSDLTSRKDFKYSFPQWGPRLQWCFPADQFAIANLGSIEETDGYDSAGIPLVEGASRLYAVPKTQKGPRLIAAEPTCNQWCQQSVRSFLSDSIAKSYLGESIDFCRQDLSGELARTASLTGTHATVDLSAASDRLSCAVVERMFRINPTILSACIASRTRYLLNDIDKKSPKLHKLRKFASMGSALTFPIQSIVFLTLCLAAGLSVQPHGLADLRSMCRQVRVYGDDLIVPVSWMPSVERLFSLLQLKINRDKTFSRGLFRESCGSDCFNGYDVTAGQVRQFYRESRLTTLEGHVAASNNLFKKGLWHAADALVRQIPLSIGKLIPLMGMGSESFGLVSTSGQKFFSRKRWNHDLQVEENQVLAFSAGTKSSFKYEGFSNLLQYFTEDPSSSDMYHWESGVVLNPLTVVRKRWVSTI